uniref:RRM domain-containing protein n=1 Tax=Mesocestoides corti TaxID=53468 RepID=A0A5K3F2J2_MESCO
MRQAKMKKSTNSSRETDQWKRAPKEKRFAALKVSHLPKHFEESQLKKYFQQFGLVHSIFLPRSRKTLKPKDLAFILVEKEAAPIIAKTVHNVLNFNRIMKCEVIEDYDARMFNQTPRTVSTTELEKNRRANSAIKASSRASRRRTKNVQGRIAALKRLTPGFRFQTTITEAPTPPIP